MEGNARTWFTPKQTGRAVNVWRTSPERLRRGQLGRVRGVSDEGEEGLSEKVNAASAALVDRGLRAQDALGKSCTH